MNIKQNTVIDIATHQDKNEISCMSTAVRDSLAKYLNDLDGNFPGDLYDMVMRQVEEPLLKTVMEIVDGNQSRAAEYLGINRGTLRKKLKLHHLL